MHSWYLQLWAGGWESARRAAFSLPYIFFELSTNCNMYSTCTACDDLLRQYTFFTVLHFCRESENFAGGSVRSASSQLSYPDPLSKLLHYHFNSNPSANFRNYKGNIKQICDSSFYMYKHSRFLYSMEVLLIYQKINLFFLQCYTIVCIKNSQSSKSTMPTKNICPARIPTTPLKENGQECSLQINMASSSICPPKKSGCLRGTLRCLHFPARFPQAAPCWVEACCQDTMSAANTPLPQWRKDRISSARTQARGEPPPADEWGWESGPKLPPWGGSSTSAAVHQVEGEISNGIWERYSA